MRHAALLILCSTLTACAHAGGVSLQAHRSVDLTHAFGERTLYWPTATSGFTLQRQSHGTTPGGWFYASNAFCAPEHGGTHLDAPIHFAERGQTADQVPLERLVAPAVVIDVRDRTASDPDYRLTAADVTAWERRHGRIAPGTIVLLHTGWGALYPDRRRYFGDDTPGDVSRLHFPSYGEDAAMLLVRERGVAALGVDAASIDYGQSSDFRVHRVAAEANVPGLENLVNLDQLPPRGALVVALPMKIEGGSGGPLRAIALLPR
jgi:kynurenine formamidase